MDKEALLALQAAAYRAGMDIAAQERAYVSYEAFAKEAATLGSMASAGAVGRRLMGYGALAGGGIGAAQGLLSGPSDQSFGDRLMRGAAHGAVGAGMGAGLGYGTGRFGQQAYLKHLAQSKGVRGTMDALRKNPTFYSQPLSQAKSWANTQLTGLKNWSWGK